MFSGPLNLQFSNIFSFCNKVSSYFTYINLPVIHIFSKENQGRRRYRNRRLTVFSCPKQTNSQNFRDVVLFFYLEPGLLRSRRLLECWREHSRDEMAQKRAYEARVLKLPTIGHWWVNTHCVQVMQHTSPATNRRQSIWLVQHRPAEFSRPQAFKLSACVRTPTHTHRDTHTNAHTDIQNALLLKVAWWLCDVRAICLFRSPWGCYCPSINNNSANDIARRNGHNNTPQSRAKPIGIIYAS